MPGTVVRANVNFAVGDNRVAVGLRAQFDGPFDVGAVVNVPLDWNVFSVRSVVLAGPSAPLRPVFGANFQHGKVFDDFGCWIVILSTHLPGTKTDRQREQRQQVSRIVFHSSPSELFGSGCLASETLVAGFTRIRCRSRNPELFRVRLQTGNPGFRESSCWKP